MFSVAVTVAESESDLILFKDSSYTVGLKPEKNSAFVLPQFFVGPWNFAHSFVFGIQKKGWIAMINPIIISIHQIE